jgi:DNA-binding CsgD family transcriptional regulator
MSYGLKQTTEKESFDLTRLELIGLTLVANGIDASEIASRLSASEAGIEQILLGTERKLGASNRLHAITIAIQQGLIGIEVKE